MARLRRAWRRARRGFRAPPPRPVPARPDQWAVGIYVGESPLALRPAPGAENPVLTPADVIDRRAHLVADPFLTRVGPTWHMFVEVDSRRGEIALATSADGLRWEYEGVVLAEPFHMSYPQVFEWQGEMFMVPETHQAESVRLYRAKRYPYEWEFLCPLLDGAPFSDPTLVRRNDGWWMWVEVTDFRFDALQLFHAPRLEGPWTAHPLNPVVSGDARRSRPAGKAVELGGRLVRFAQDCVPSYGSRVRALEVLRLDAEGYEEKELPESPILEGSGSGWNATGMHHVDLHQLGDGSWLAAVDGWAQLAEDAP